MRRILLAWMMCAALFAASLPLRGQDNGIEVDYAHPRSYVIGGLSVEGNNYFRTEQILQLTGLNPGTSITVPGEETAAVVRRLFLQRFFEDVSFEIDHTNAAGDTAWFVVRITERPRVSRWTFSGVRSGEKKTSRNASSCAAAGNSPNTWRKPAPTSSSATTRKKDSSSATSRHSSCATRWFATPSA